MQSAIGTRTKSSSKNDAATANEIILSRDASNAILVCGDEDSGLHEFLLTMIESQVIHAGKRAMVQDTTGILSSIVLPFLAGEHVKKLRKAKKTAGEELLGQISPLVWVFNTAVGGNRLNVVKYRFPLINMLSRIAGLEGNQSILLEQTFHGDAEAILRDVLVNLVAIAFGKDYKKFRKEASEFASYLVQGFMHAGNNGKSFVSWKEFKVFVEHPKNVDVEMSKHLKKHLDSYLYTVEYYVLNSLLFIEGIVDAGNLSSRPIADINLHLLYLEDTTVHERLLIGSLLILDMILEGLNVHRNFKAPLSLLPFDGDDLVVIDDTMHLFPANESILKPMNSTRSFFEHVINKGSSLFMNATGTKMMNVDSFYRVALEPAITQSFTVNLFLGKMSGKEDVTAVSRLKELLGIGKVGVNLINLPPGRFLMVPGEGDVEPFLVDAREPSVKTLNVKQGLLKKVLSVPIGAPLILDTRPQDEGDQVESGEPESVRTPRDGPSIPDSKKDDGSQSSLPAVRGLPRAGDSQPKRVEIAKDAIDVNPEETEGHDAGAVETRGEEHAKKGLHGDDDRMDGKEAGEMGKSPAQDQIDSTSDLFSVLDELESKNPFVGSSFKNQFDGTGENVVIRELESGLENPLDYNLMLDVLLFKLEKVIKTPHGVDLFKELMEKKRLNFERALTMYYEETRTLLDGKFCVREGKFLVYKGIITALEKIMAELGFGKIHPDDKKVRALEYHLRQALSISRSELLERVKNGSLYF
ncbi:hypothetical protein GF325_10775 [Candidatus Bathyarchaeota archaeon]|nr:hypothetical protein [Candidatus Bathyarchaeota archaeon]